MNIDTTPKTITARPAAHRVGENKPIANRPQASAAAQTHTQHQEVANRVAPNKAVPNRVNISA